MALPGMTTSFEREALFRWGRDRWQGFGEVVDLGSWLGSLIAAFAEGVRHRLEGGPPWPAIHAYERFQYEPWMEKEFVRCHLDVPERIGESFEGLFWKLIEPWKDQVVLYPGDIMTYRWTGGPIELLVVDVMKSWALADFTLHEFLPHLVPGRSSLLHQDFAHFATPWVALSMFRLREYFELEEAVERSGSLLFRCVKMIPPEVLSHAGDAPSYTPGECDEALSWAEELACPTRRGELIAARVMHEIEMRRMMEIGRPMKRMFDCQLTEPAIAENVVRRFEEVLPSVASRAEIEALLAWAQKEFDGSGRLVDLGTGLGSSAIALAEGLRRSARPTAKEVRIEAVDTFRYTSWMNHYFEAFRLPRLQHGESFRPIFERLIEPWSDQISTYEGDAVAYLPTVKPIRLLIVDCVDYWEQMQQVLRSTLPLMKLPGSILVARGFLDESVGLLPLLIFPYRDLLTVERRDGTNVWFRTTGPLSEKSILEGPLLAVDSAQLDGAMNWAGSVAGGEAELFQKRWRATMELLAERYGRTADLIEEVLRSAGDQRAFLMRTIDRFFDKLMYQLNGDRDLRIRWKFEEWEQSGLDRSDDIGFVLWQMWKRFRDQREGKHPSPFTWNPSRASEDLVATHEDSTLAACRRVEKVAREVGWAGNNLVRLRDVSSD
jgi:hypothetical protein